MDADSKKSEFKRRVRHWADRLEVKIVWLGVRPMRNKWASCSTAGHLNFNDELLDLDRDLWDYVIVHELLHFFVPNHGKLWKSLMRAHLGDYDEIERQLRRISADCLDAPSKTTAPTA
jgi:predicted metal-dependent hydrolase